MSRVDVRGSDDRKSRTDKDGTEKGDREQGCMDPYSVQSATGHWVTEGVVHRNP